MFLLDINWLQARWQTARVLLPASLLHVGHPHGSLLKIKTKEINFCLHDRIVSCQLGLGHLRQFPHGLQIMSSVMTHFVVFYTLTHESLQVSSLGFCTLNQKQK